MHPNIVVTQPGENVGVKFNAFEGLLVKTLRTIPYCAQISMPTKIRASVSISVGMTIALVMLFPSNGTQYRSDMMDVSTANIFGRSGLNNSVTLKAGAYFGIPNSTDTLISFESYFSLITGVRDSAVVLEMVELDLLVQVVLPRFSFYRWGGGEGGTPLGWWLTSSMVRRVVDDNLRAVYI